MGDAAGDPTAGGGDRLPDCRLPTILRPVECFEFGEASTDTTGPLAMASWSVPVGDSDAKSGAPGKEVAKEGVDDEDSEDRAAAAEQAVEAPKMVLPPAAKEPSPENATEVDEKPLPAIEAEKAAMSDELDGDIVRGEAGDDTEKKEAVAEEAMGTQEFNVTGGSDSVFVASVSKALTGVSVVDTAGANAAALISAFVPASMLVAVSFASTNELTTAADLVSASLASAAALAAAEAWSGAAKT
jgi:hypothetical protein